jgi:ribosomal protein S18 acetylase RimI-like enzyme
MQAAFEEYRGTLDPPSGASTETVADVERVMAKGGAVLAWEGDTPVGSARFTLYPDHMYVGRVSVLPTHRRRGIATAMMAYLEDLARQAGRPSVEIAARAALPSNVRLYQALGYQTVRIEPHPRGPEMNVVHMRKWL